MKIEDDSKNKTIDELGSGRVFRDAVGGVWMVCCLVETQHVEALHRSWQCVNLASGQIVGMYCDREVTPINAKVVIE